MDTQLVSPDGTTAPTAPTAPITAQTVTGRARMGFMPKHFAAHRMINNMIRVENSVFNTMGRMSEDYSGGSWRFVELSNGGGYMAPDAAPAKRINPRGGPAGTMRFVVEGNGFDEDIDPDTAGVIVCLFVFCNLAGPEDDDHFAEKYHQLHDYACTRADYSTISRAID